MTKTFHDLKNYLGPAMVFWLYAVVSGVALLFVALFLPETKGKSLEVSSFISNKEQR